MSSSGIEPGTVRLVVTYSNSICWFCFWNFKASLWLKAYERVNSEYLIRPLFELQFRICTTYRGLRSKPVVHKLEICWKWLHLWSLIAQQGNLFYFMMHQWIRQSSIHMRSRLHQLRHSSLSHLASHISQHEDPRSYPISFTSELWKQLPRVFSFLQS
jgi:hypothetical protein